jgi:hypothetical protein
MNRGVARREREGQTARGAGLEGAPMMPTSISITKLLFYKIISVCLSKKVLIIDVLVPHLDKKQI